MRVHPELLNTQSINKKRTHELWRDCYESINDHEKHLARNGTMILKFWLNVSKEKQKKRFMERLNKPEKNWKFTINDIQERQHWDKYMDAFEQALRETNRPWAPCYAIPADNKAFIRMTVAKTIESSLQTINLQYTSVTDEDQKRIELARQTLTNVR